MSSPELQKHILATLAYYDGMDYPMTSFELWKYLTSSKQQAENEGQFSLGDVVQELENENLKKFIDEHRGFYFLKGRKDLVEQRLERNKIANQKLKRLLKTAKWLRFVPFVRMLAVTGSLAMKNTDAGSDLDLLIVLKHGKIFTGRFGVTGLLQLLGQRRYGDKIKNRICLNYFITDKSLEINLKDIFSASEYAFMLPIFGWHAFQEFQEKNGWIRKYKLNFQPDALPDLKFLAETNLSQLVRTLGEAVLRPNFIENFLKHYQLGKIEKNPKTHQSGSLILASDERLVFLPEPSGPKVYEKFQARLNGLK